MKIYNHIFFLAAFAAASFTAAVKVGRNCDPRGDPRGTSSCDILGDCSPFTENPCPEGTAYGIYYEGFSEYECYCESGDGSPPANKGDACLLANAVCDTTAGYKLTRDDGQSDEQSVGGNGLFYACNCVDEKCGCIPECNVGGCPGTGGSRFLRTG